MNERILNSFRRQRVAKTLRSNCEALSLVGAAGCLDWPTCATEFLVDSGTEEAYNSFKNLLSSEAYRG